MQCNSQKRTYQYYGATSYFLTERHPNCGNHSSGSSCTWLSRFDNQVFLVRKFDGKGCRNDILREGFQLNLKARYMPRNQLIPLRVAEQVKSGITIHFVRGSKLKLLAEGRRRKGGAIGPAYKCGMILKRCVKFQYISITHQH